MSIMQKQNKNEKTKKWMTRYGYLSYLSRFGPSLVWTCTSSLSLSSVHRRNRFLASACRYESSGLVHYIQPNYLFRICKLPKWVRTKVFEPNIAYILQNFIAISFVKDLFHSYLEGDLGGTHHKKTMSPISNNFSVIIGKKKMSRFRGSWK